MGQRDILEFLEEQFKKNPQKFFTEKEIGEETGRNQGTCSVSLRALRKYNEVEYFKGSNPRGSDTYYYRHKSEKDVLSIYLNTKVRI